VCPSENPVKQGGRCSREAVGEAVPVFGERFLRRSWFRSGQVREQTAVRGSAVELGDLITAADLDEEGALWWLGEDAWREADLPALVKMEVESLLATRIPLAG
jgi:hypothetical protein